MRRLAIVHPLACDELSSVEGIRGQVIMEASEDINKRTKARVSEHNDN